MLVEHTPMLNMTRTENKKCETERLRAPGTAGATPASCPSSIVASLTTTTERATRNCSVTRSLPMSSSRTRSPTSTPRSLGMSAEPCRARECITSYPGVYANRIACTASYHGLLPWLADADHAQRPWSTTSETGSTRSAVTQRSTQRG